MSATLLGMAMTGNAQTPGTLDVTFDGDGMTNIEFGSGHTYGWGIAVGGADNLYIAGWHSNITQSISIARLTSTGELDTGFGGDGKASGTFGQPYPRGYGTTYDPVSGDIVVVGQTSATLVSNRAFGVARFDDAGGPVASFGINGAIFTDFPFPWYDAVAKDVVLQTDNKIVVVGEAMNGGLKDFALARYTSDGMLDSTFSGDGRLAIDVLGENDLGNAVAIQDDGKIIMAGTSMVQSERFFSLVRLQPDGSLDSTFGTNGKMAVAASVGHETFCFDVAINPLDETILVAGVAGQGATVGGLAKILPNGTMDPDFGTSGYCTFSAGGSVDAGFYAIATQADDKIVCVGYSGNATSSVFLVVTFSANGEPSLDFAPGGAVETSFGTGMQELANAVAIQPDGRITAGGMIETNSGYQMALARYWPSLTVGIQDWSWEASALNVYPNPIDRFTRISYMLPVSGPVSIELYDLHGHSLATYVEGKDLGAGHHEETIAIPPELASGNYLLVLSGPSGKMRVQVTK